MPCLQPSILGGLTGQARGNGGLARFPNNRRLMLGTGHLPDVRVCSLVSQVNSSFQLSTHTEGIIAFTQKGSGRRGAFLNRHHNFQFSVRLCGCTIHCSEIHSKGPVEGTPLPSLKHRTRHTAVETWVHCSVASTQRPLAGNATHCSVPTVLTTSPSRSSNIAGFRLAWQQWRECGGAGKKMGSLREGLPQSQSDAARCLGQKHPC